MTAAPTLRPYQVKAIERLREKIREGKRRLVLVMPTGGGKTIVASAMIHSAIAKGSRALFFAHRRELVDQTIDKLSQWGVHSGVIMAHDRRRDDWLPVQVASVMTLVRRLDRKPRADIVVVDECHHATSESYQKVLDAYPDAVIIGLTATPWRSDRVGLNDIYEDSILACTPAELMHIGALVEYEAFAYDAPDLHSIKIRAGDFDQKALGLACNTKVLVGAVVREYLAHAAGRRGIVFPVNIAHSNTLVDEFRTAGFSAAHVDCNTATGERKQAMDDFRSGKLTILSSVGVLTEGFDAPAAEVCILARPTKSLTLYLQMIGRVLRPSPDTGKQKALVHDHSGNMIRHGFVEDDRDYALTATPDRIHMLNTCPECFRIFAATKQGRCPHCNALIALPDTRAESGGREKHLTVEGQRISRDAILKMRGKRAALQLDLELTDEQIALASVATRQQKAAEYLRLQEVQKRKNFKDGFVAHQFRSIFCHWPRFTDEELVGITPATTPFFPLPARRQVG